jgi:hypothetical protein
LLFIQPVLAEVWQTSEELLLKCLSQLVDTYMKVSGVEGPALTLRLLLCPEFEALILELLGIVVLGLFLLLMLMIERNDFLLGLLCFEVIHGRLEGLAAASVLPRVRGLNARVPTILILRQVDSSGDGFTFS